MSEHSEKYVRIVVTDLGGKVKVVTHRLHESPPETDHEWYDSERDRPDGEREILLYRYTPFPGTEDALKSLDAETWPEFHD